MNHDHDQRCLENLKVDTGLPFTADTAPAITGAHLGTAVIAMFVSSRIKHGDGSTRRSVPPNIFPVLVAAGTTLPGAGPGSSVLF